MSRTPTSGSQHTLRAAGYQAVVSSVGATLRSLRHGSRDIVVPFDADQLRPAMSGALLAPWPNRLRDGRYAFGGRSHQLPINEPATRSASHGLVAWLDFAAVSGGSDHLTLQQHIQPQPGYPWRVRLTVDFHLSDEGLRQETTAVNESATPAPLGLGAHPYVIAGTVAPRAIDDGTLHLSAGVIQPITPDRSLPDGAPIPIRSAGAEWDYSVARRVGGAVVNHAYGELTRDDEGVAVVSFTDAVGSGVELLLDHHHRWLQVYTADQSPPIPLRGALALEPMTCPPDAFNTGRDLITLEPSIPISVAWSLRALAPHQ